MLDLQFLPLLEGWAELSQEQKTFLLSNYRYIRAIPLTHSGLMITIEGMWMIRRRLSQLSEDLTDEAVGHLVSLAEQLRAMPDKCRPGIPHLSLVARATLLDVPRKPQPVKMHLTNRPARSWVDKELAVASLLLKLQGGRRRHR